MEIQIEHLNTENAREVQRLSAQLGYPISVIDIENNIKEMASDNEHAAFVAIMDTKVVGWIHALRILLLETKPFIEIGGLVVDENYRHEGIGKKLLERVKQWCLEKGVHELRVRSNSKRNDAHRFYINNGFKEIKEQKVFQILADANTVS